MCPHTQARVFHRRLTSGGIFNNRLLFKNNMLLFSLLFSGNFSGEDKALMEGDKIVMGDPPEFPTKENPASCYSNWEQLLISD